MRVKRATVCVVSVVLAGLLWTDVAQAFFFCMSPGGGNRFSNGRGSLPGRLPIPLPSIPLASPWLEPGYNGGGESLESLKAHQRAKPAVRTNPWRSVQPLTPQEPRGQ